MYRREHKKSASIPLEEIFETGVGASPCVRPCPDERRCWHTGARKVTPLRLIAITCLLLLVTACGPTVNQVKPQQTVTIGKAFQTQATPLPTVPPYRCGAWASNNAPNRFSTILVLAKLTQNIKGVQGATAAATVHFAGGDATLQTPPASDPDGMVSFTLPLQGRQPAGLPTTISVSFTIKDTTVQCSSAFFTPQ